MMNLPCLALTVLLLASCHPAAIDTNYFTTIDRCELEALTLGTQIMDAYNHPKTGEAVPRKLQTEIYLCQEFLERELGFAAQEMLDHCGRNLTAASPRVRELQAAGGWLDPESPRSSYAPLFDRRIYLLGDSTIRQVFASMAAITFKDTQLNTYHKQWTRRHCARQPLRHLDHTGFIGGCEINEVTCDVTGFGPTGQLTFDWKHYPYEHYDDHLWGDEGAFRNPSSRRPEVLVVQMGVHPCVHTHPDNPYGKYLHEVNYTGIAEHEANIDKLFATIRRTIEMFHLETNRTKQVIVMTSGLNFMGLQTDQCIVRFNRLQAEAARRFGFAVLDRGELQARAIYTSLHAETAGHFIPHIHLQFPIPAMVTTVLTKLIGCLEGIDMSTPLN